MCVTCERIQMDPRGSRKARKSEAHVQNQCRFGDWMDWQPCTDRCFGVREHGAYAVVPDFSCVLRCYICVILCDCVILFVVCSLKSAV